jgi:hypothetical protein
MVYHTIGYNGMPHWCLKYEMGKARALIARFEAQLRAQGRLRGRKGRERQPLLKAGKKAIMGPTRQAGCNRGRGEVDLGSWCKIGYHCN